MAQQLITIIDPPGRTVIGELVGETNETLTLKNPGILHVQPTQNGQLNVQVIPLYFREFIGEKNKTAGTTWQYTKSSIVIGLDIENDSRLVTQYNQLFAPLPAAPTSEPKIVKLFD